MCCCVGHIVAVDSVSPTVFCISETGELIRWFDCSDYMREPSDIAISGKEYFVCDFKVLCLYEAHSKTLVSQMGNVMRSQLALNIGTGKSVGTVQYTYSSC